MPQKKKPSPDAAPLVIKRKAVPHEFVLDALAAASPYTRPMFGCLAIYVGEKIVGVLRDKQPYADDNGFWLATTHEQHESLRRDFPSMRSIRLLGEKVSNWQVLPMTAPDFEESALRACDMILAGDPRIGRIPSSRRVKSPRSSARKTTTSPKRKK